MSLQFQATTKVGAVPLVSPTSGQIEYGLVVKPRFDWPGIGPMLSDMGWRVIPAPLALPLLPRSERNVPPWVLSAIVLFRIEALLNQLARRFELVEEHRSAPRGTVDWSNYAVRQMPRAHFTRVPCRFPDLRDDRALRSAIRFTLQKQFDSLAGQSSAGVFVIQLIELCNSLIERVRDAPPHPPTALQFDAWLRSPLKSSAFFDGLQAVQWTVDERGLGGLSDLEGLPWRMSMEQFFEAWVEAVLVGVSRRIGGTVRSGRKRQTLTPIEWEPPYVGSQKSLVPDLLLDRGDTTIIIDAKYKEHWEEMQERRWGDLEEELRERHRDDLLQVLAYANTTSAPHVIVCLAYPCRQTTWLSLKERGRLFHRAALRANERRIDLRLTALPMGVPMHKIVDALAEEFARED
ncbi:MAG: hypothetical protein KGK07_14575 [Chloroflexota bacterium]|nr:hypothetical protein [Chloroflexota bacterium]